MHTRKTQHDVLRHHCIGNYTTEPQHPHQNPAEMKARYLKKNSNSTMDHTITPPSCGYSVWFLWQCCWILLQCLTLVGGHILRFPSGLFRKFLHLSSLSGGSRSITCMVMDQGFKSMRINWYIGVAQLKTVVMQWYIW